MPKKLIIFLLFPLLFIFSCRIEYKADTVYTTEQQFNVLDFTKLRLAGNFEVFYNQSEEPSILVKAKDEATLGNITIEHNNNTLYVYCKSDTRSSSTTTINNRRVNINTSDRYMLFVSSPNLENIEQAGVSTINFDDGTELSKLYIDTAGVATLNMNEVNIGSFTLETAGSITANLSGFAENFTIETAGSARIDAQNFICDNVEIETAGYARVQITALNRLNVDTAGSGRVNYWGDPVVRQSIAGSGRVQKMGRAE